MTFLPCNITPNHSTIMVTWRVSFLLLRIMTPRFRWLHNLRIDVPMLTHRFLQNPMMRNSTTLISVSSITKTSSSMPSMSDLC
jgi:hypothetical protein